MVRGWTSFWRMWGGERGSGCDAWGFVYNGSASGEDVRCELGPETVCAHVTGRK
jgi:hypothetical protein